MAGSEQNGSRRRDPREERLLQRFRLISIGVVLLMIVLVVTVDSLGRLFIDPEFQASQVFLGVLAGTLVTLFGFEGLARVGRRDE